MASPNPALSMPPASGRDWGATLLVFGLTCAWVATWIAAGPEARPNLLFREGGPIDLLNSTWLIGAALMFWLAHVVAARSSLGVFWAVAALGLLLLGIDERFQGHELLSRKLDAPTPLGMRNWSDVVVLGYAALAAGLLVWRWGELWRASRLRWLGVAALGLAAISTAIDSVLPSSEAKDLWEESFKVLSGAGLLAVSLEAFRMGCATRAQGDVPTPSALRAMAVPVLAAILVLAIAVLVQDEQWNELMSVNWGSPQSWLVCVLLWVAALTLLVVLPALPAASHGPPAQGESGPGVGVVPATLGAYLALLGCGEGLAATEFRLLDDLVANQFPATAMDQLEFMHAPLALPGCLFLLSATAMAVILICGRTLPGSFLRLSLAGLSLLCLALIVNQLGGEASELLFAPGLRIVGATCFLLASLNLTTTLSAARHRATSPAGAHGHSSP